MRWMWWLENRGAVIWLLHFLSPFSTSDPGTICVCFVQFQALPKLLLCLNEVGKILKVIEIISDQYSSSYSHLFYVEKASGE